MANGLGYRQLAECETRICRLRPGLLVNLIIFLQHCRLFAMNRLKFNFSKF